MTYERKQFAYWHEKTAYSKSVINSPYTQAMERSPMDQLLHTSLGVLYFSSIFSIFHNSL